MKTEKKEKALSVSEGVGGGASFLKEWSEEGGNSTFVDKTGIFWEMEMLERERELEWWGPWGTARPCAG